MIRWDFLVLESELLDGGNEVVGGSWGAEVLTSLFAGGGLGGPWGTLLGFVGGCTFPLGPGFAEGLKVPVFELFAMVFYPSIRFFIF